MKYVIYKHKADWGDTIYYPYIIPEHVNHNEFVPNKEVDRPKLDLHSAGFFYINGIQSVIVDHHGSESLGIKPNLVTDSKIISNLLSNTGQYGFID